MCSSRSGEFSGPVTHSVWWWLVPGLGALLVIVWYAGLWWWARPPKARRSNRGRTNPDVRAQHLARIDEIERDVLSGALSVRNGYQLLSTVVRSFAEERTGVPATRMAVADLRATGAPVVADRLASAIEVMYPPEFAPSATDDRGRFRRDAARAREVLTSWS